VIVALDSEAFNALAGPDSQRKRRLRRILRAAHQLGRDVLVPTLVLAELYRGHGRIVGGVLAAAGAGSTLMVDAHVVAVAVEAGGGVVVTGDHADLERLSASYRHLAVERI
jgi:predicted nucleic acid-binding protein